MRYVAQLTESRGNFTHRNISLLYPPFIPHLSSTDEMALPGVVSVRDHTLCCLETVESRWES